MPSRQPSQGQPTGWSMSCRTLRVERPAHDSARRVRRPQQALLRAGAHRQQSQYPIRDAWWIGPVWHWSTHTIPVVETDYTMSLSQEDLAKVTKTAVFLEQETKDEGNSKAIHGRGGKKKLPPLEQPSRIHGG